MIQEYRKHLSEELASHHAIEHSYRPALKSFLESLNPLIQAINEPTRSEHGAPDFVILDRKNVNMIRGYLETKGINVHLDKVENSEQLKRYFGYSNLILTNYLEFRFFRNGEKFNTISIGTLVNGSIQFNEDNFGILERELKAFLDGKPESITNAKKLAQIMGGKASRVRDNVSRYMKDQDETSQELVKIYKAMKELLVHDLTYENFADMYAQTLVYGLFVARYYDETPDTFTREEARDLIPASNPFLRHFFAHIAGPNFDKRLRYIVDELCQVFSVSDIRTIIQRHYNLFGEVVDKDPIIHFYEDFLKEYDPVLRKKMGAYYTPVPVVQFMVRAVDDILKKEFALADGLADVTRLAQSYMQQGTKSKRSLHKVQILDPAVGTATFLNEIIKHIYQKFKGQEGLWKSYVNEELLPRLYGFELMMAPYTIAHLKLAMTLKETGVDHFDKRLGVYLTNTLEEGVKDQQDLFVQFGFAEAISEESKSANVIKHDRPIMVIIGNPPYSVSSSNKSEYIENLMKDYKEGLNEKNIQPLSDDYIKFIRFAEEMVEKNKNGLISFITNNSYLDGIIHRQIRKHLLQTFDKIYILNLHGSVKRMEMTPEGEKDQNVFEIQQGVSIIIAIKNNMKRSSQMGKVYQMDIYGTRFHKFNILNNSMLYNSFKDISPLAPNYFFVPKNNDLMKEYERYTPIDKIFIKQSSGITTSNDQEMVSFNSFDQQNIKYAYKPFDLRNLNYNEELGRPRKGFTENFFNKNIAITIMRKPVNSKDLSAIFVVENMIDKNYYGFQSYVFPLYLYQENRQESNFRKEIVDEVEKIVGKILPEDFFDYIYAVLYSPSYRQKYKEFLNIDFPRIPYPINKEAFKKQSTSGRKLRHLHLLDDADLEKLITSYPISGDNLVEKVEYRNGNVFINDLQFFGDVPKEAWEFYIGGYQPAQKWLKYRKGRMLMYEDIIHYQKIIVSLTETIKIMQKIDSS